MFLAFLATALAGLALLIWNLGPTSILSQRLSLIGAVLIIASGSVAATTYPWVGGVERALFYPLVLVVLPLVVLLLIRNRQPSSATSH